MIPKTVAQSLDDITGCESDLHAFHYVILAYWIATGACRRHNFDRDYYFCSAEVRAKWWGGKNRHRKVLDQLNAKFGWLDICDVKSGATHQVLFKLSDEGESAILSAMERVRETETEWLDSAGRLVNRAKPVLRSKDQSGGDAKRPNKWGITWLCAVNVAALEAAEVCVDEGLGLDPKRITEESSALLPGIREFWQDQKRTRDYLVACKKQINGILATANNPRFGNGNYPQVYQQSRAGRWYCESGTGLQNHRRFVREIALWNHHKYDIANAQLALLLQLAGETIESKFELGLYLTTKEYSRKLFSEIADLTADEAKQAIIALAFGSNPTSYNMANTLQGKNEQFFENSAMKALAREIRETREQAIARAPSNKTGILNCLGRLISHSATPSQKVAHLAQGAEAACLMAVIESPWADNLTMLLHDGWYSSEPMPVEELQRWIKDHTGFNVVIEVR